MAKARAEAAEGQEVHGQIKKTEAVRIALEQGKESPGEGVAFIKKKFGLDVTPQQFSTYKSIAKSKGKGGGKKRGRKPKAAMRYEHTVGNGLVALDDLEAAKSLVAKVGAEQAK